MTAQCAACMGGIAKGDKFVLAGTEVFHRGCIANVRESLAMRQQARIAELERLIAQLKPDAFDAARLRTAIDDANRDARNVRGERDSIEKELRIARQVIAIDKREVERVREENERLRTEMERLRTERDEAAALLRTQRETENKRSETAKTSEVQDDTRIRFGLLELD
jgi:hypothetical protein